MSRIAAVKSHMISVPRRQPVWTAHEQIKAWNVILTEVHTDDGSVGYGQIHGAPMPRICEWVERFGEIARARRGQGEQLVPQGDMLQRVPPVNDRGCHPVARDRARRPVLWQAA